MSRNEVTGHIDITFKYDNKLTFPHELPNPVVNWSLTPSGEDALTCKNIPQLVKTEVINLEVSKEECVEIFRERNGKGEIM